MGIGIITFTYGDNFGQRLQNLAVQEKLKRYDLNVQTIRQKEKMKMKIKRYFVSFSERKGFREIRRHIKFLNFDRTEITYYKKKVSEGRIPQGLVEDFNFFVAGSDQIWSPYSPDVNDIMFLTFAPRKKRIALSPSMATDCIPEWCIERYKNYFGGFDYLSVREAESAVLIEQLTGQSVKTLVDPTLLHESDFWIHYEKKPRKRIPNHYALVYCLGEKKEEERINKVCKECGYEIVDIMANKKWYDIGPSEFLYLIEHAGLVITDSYHGTIFSIIFKVPFLIVNRAGASVNMNSRFKTLFEKLKIAHRSLDDYFNNTLYPLNYLDINKRIKYEQKKVENYLEMCMKA